MDILSKKEGFFLSQTMTCVLSDDKKQTVVKIRISDPYLVVRINDKEYFLTRNGNIEGTAQY